MNTDPIIDALRAVLDATELELLTESDADSVPGWVDYVRHHVGRVLPVALGDQPPESLDDEHDDGYCELHDFKRIGQVGSMAGTFAVIDVGSGPSLNDWFKHLTGNDIVDPPEMVEWIAAGRAPESITEWSPALEEWAEAYGAAQERLRQFTGISSHQVVFDGWKGYKEDGVVIVAGQGDFPVYARYCDPDGTEHMSICELRIDLHRHNLDGLEGDELDAAYENDG